LLVVLALHGLLLLILRDALGRASRAQRRELAMVWLDLAPSRPQAAASAAARSLRLPARPAAPPPLPAPTKEPPLPVAVTAPAVSAPIDWSAEAQRAAQAALKQAARDRRAPTAMGAVPHSNFGVPASRPQFPWSRQPQGGIVDFDPGSFVLTLSLKRCQISYFLIVAGFGCDIAGKDPEPGRSDLFDPKYAPQPLELPRPLLEAAPASPP